MCFFSWGGWGAPGSYTSGSQAVAYGFTLRGLFARGIQNLEELCENCEDRLCPGKVRR